MPFQHTLLEPHKLKKQAAEAASLRKVTAQDTESLWPRPKLLTVAGNAASAEGISTFANWGAALNVLRNADASFRPAAPGIRCWGRCCSAMLRNQFPPRPKSGSWPGRVSLRRGGRLPTTWPISKKRVHLSVWIVLGSRGRCALRASACSEQVTKAFRQSRRPPPNSPFG